MAIDRALFYDYEHWFAGLSMSRDIFQTITLKILDEIHAENLIGEYKQPQSEESTWDSVSIVDGLAYTNHVIPIKSVWNYVMDDLYSLDVNCTTISRYERHIVNEIEGSVDIEGVITLHLEYLVEAGYLVDLNTRVDEDSEYSFKFADGVEKLING